MNGPPGQSILASPPKDQARGQNSAAEGKSCSNDLTPPTCVDSKGISSLIVVAADKMVDQIFVRFDFCWILTTGNTITILQSVSCMMYHRSW